MYKTLETDRLILTLLDEKSADKVLEFLIDNREDFTKYEGIKKEIYFSKVYQEYVLKNEYEASLKRGYLRYYIFEKTNPDKVIGTVSYGHVNSYPYCSAVLGYKMAMSAKNKGYGTEAVIAANEIAYEYLGLHRLEAFVMEDNFSSIRLLEKAGFLREGKCIQKLNVNGEWKDHLLFGKIK